VKLPKATLVKGFYWAAAAVVGLVAVGYAKLIVYAQGLYFSAFDAQPILTSLATPVLFVIATYAVVRAAPSASGSGIPQVIEAIEASRKDHEAAWTSALVSIRTAVIKILSSVIGIFGGASIGREGPTVQVAASVFAWVGRVTRKFGAKADFPTYLVGGGAAGVAAAFHTPLAGITFALEELADGTFGPFKRMAIISVVVAGVTAQAVVGNYLYFGHPAISGVTAMVIPQALLIGIVGGTVGGVFARLLAHPPIRLMPKSWWLRAFFCGTLCAIITFATKGGTAGSGYEITRQFMDSPNGDLPWVFPIGKLATTVLSYYSGMAGGIFSPSLAIGAGVGTTVAKIAHFTDLKACALMGMVAFFSGAIQAPLTGVIIVMEMSDQHALIIPFLVTAFLAQRLGQVFLKVPLYKFLALKRASG